MKAVDYKHSSSAYFLFMKQNSIIIGLIFDACMP